MRVKTKDLEGNALCYAVCMIEMPHLVWGKTIGLHHASHQIVVPELPEPQCYSPFTGWDMVGPIIEREGIEILCNVTAREADRFIEGTRPDWFACLKTRKGSHWHGMTPMIAAMKCHVARKLGDEIDIPEELL